MAELQYGPHGQWRCTLISDGTLPPLPLEQIYPSVAPEDLDAAGGGRPYSSPMNCLLVRGGGLIAVIDTGIGRPAAQHLGPTVGHLEDSLRSEGVEPDDVDLVLITHCHPDHIGGLTVEGAPFFARARHVVSRAEWEFWTAEETLSAMPDQMAAPARVHLPVLEAGGIVDLDDGEIEVAPDLRLVPAPGHTPGHSVVEIGPPPAAFLYLADAFPHPLSFARPDWAAFSDGAPDGAAETRRRLLEEVADSDRLVASFHVAGVGQVEKAGTAYRFTTC